jgi:putative sterol carrier protein
LVKFLTEEWLEALNAALEAHQGFKDAIATTELSLQFEVTDAPEGTLSTYLVTISGGSARATAGPGDNPDVIVKNDYATAVAIVKDELNVQMAFMAGKIKAAGPGMTKLITGMGMLKQFTSASAALTVEY